MKSAVNMPRAPTPPLPARVSTETQTDLAAPDPTIGELLNIGDGFHKLDFPVQSAALHKERSKWILAEEMSGFTEMQAKFAAARHADLGKLFGVAEDNVSSKCRHKGGLLKRLRSRSCLPESRFTRAKPKRTLPTITRPSVSNPSLKPR